MLEGRKTNIKISGEFDPIPADKYTVQVADVELVTQFNKFKGEDQEMLNYHYIILDDKQVDNGETTRGRYLWHRMSQVISNRSWLGKFLKALYGRELTRDEKEAFAKNPESILGMQVDVLVEQKPSNDGSAVFNNVTSYSTTREKLEEYEYEPRATLEVEKESEPIKTVGVPDLNPTLDDAFADALEKENKKADKGMSEEEIEEMEAKLKEAKEKAKKATK